VLNLHELYNEVAFLHLAVVAQHVGIPTRLLDFSKDPFVAAYFAAQHEGEGCFIGEMRVEAVWQLRRLEDEARTPEVPRVRIVSAPGANNLNLRAQQGVFLEWGRRDEDRSEVTKLGPKGLERVLVGEFKIYAAAKPKRGTTAHPAPWAVRWSLPAALRRELLRMLAFRRIDAGTMLPLL
jgi:hypothetical protein